MQVRGELVRGGLLGVRADSLFVADRFIIVHRQSPLGPVDSSFRAFSGRRKFTVRRQKFNKETLS